MEKRNEVHETKETKAEDKNCSNDPTNRKGLRPRPGLL